MFNSKLKPKHTTPFRVCAVCGKRHAPTYGFKGTLAYYGIEGDKAAVACVRGLHRAPLNRSSDNDQA